MKTIQEFIEENNITFALRLTDNNPNFKVNIPVYHFNVNIYYKDKTFETYWSRGYEYNKAFRDISKLKILASRTCDVDIDVIYNTLRKKNILSFPWHLNYDKPIFKKIFNKTDFLEKPKLEDILDCLTSDAHEVLGDISFEDWCSECGNNSDSIEALNTYNTIREQSIKLKKFLGEELLNELMYNVERI